MLYICADSGLLREMPQIMGVEIEYREEINATRTLDLNGLKLPISAQYFYKANAIDAKVLGRDEYGNPVFFRHGYGKGYVYFMTLPLEGYLSKKVSVFHDESAPLYNAIYRELAKCAGIKKASDSSHPFVCLTENRIDDESLYVVAINYSNRPVETEIRIADGYTKSVVWGNDLQNGCLHLRENDGSIFKLTKNNN